jgi:hypothetical protein
MRFVDERKGHGERRKSIADSAIYESRKQSDPGKDDRGGVKGTHFSFFQLPLSSRRRRIRSVHPRRDMPSASKVQKLLKKLLTLGKDRLVASVASQKHGPCERLASATIAVRR